MLTKIFSKQTNPILKFKCLIPEVAEKMPIVSSNKVNFSWTKDAIADYKKLKEFSTIHSNVNHVTKCPGIHSIFKQGWIQRSYQDIFIKTDGSGGFSWKTPIDQNSLIRDHEFKFPYIGHHDAKLFKAMPLKEPTLPTIIKIQSPWIAVIPKNYCLLVLPIPYPDDTRFTSTAGILDPDLGTNFLNVQLFWHVIQGEEVIPAGTPLAQYFLIKKEDIATEVGFIDQTDINDIRLRRLSLESTFIPSYAKLKKTFGE